MNTTRGAPGNRQRTAKFFCVPGETPWPEAVSAETRTGFAHFDARPLRRGTAPRDGERLVARCAIDEEKAADHLLRLGERAVDDARAAFAHLHARAAGVGGERVRVDQLALGGKFVGELD